MNNQVDMASAVMNLMSNPSEARNQINEFASTVQGSPKERVDQLLNSGQMSQSQYNLLSGLARNLMKVL